MPAPSEHEIQRAYIMWFVGVPGKVEPAGLPGVVTWHVPNGGSRRDGFEGRRLKELGVLAGIPDVHHLWGALHMIEFKDAEGRRSDAQNALHSRLIAAGGKVATVYNLDEAKKVARAWELVRSNR